MDHCLVNYNIKEYIQLVAQGHFDALNENFGYPKIKLEDDYMKNCVNCTVWDI